MVWKLWEARRSSQEDSSEHLGLSWTWTASVMSEMTISVLLHLSLRMGLSGEKTTKVLWPTDLAKEPVSDLPDRAGVLGELLAVEAEAEEAGSIVPVLELLVRAEGGGVIDGAVAVAVAFLVEDGGCVAVPFVGEGRAPVIDVVVVERRVAAGGIFLHCEEGALRVVGEPAGRREDGDGAELVEVQMPVVLSNWHVDEHVQFAELGGEVGGLAESQVRDGGGDDSVAFLGGSRVQLCHEGVGVMAGNHGRAEGVAVGRRGDCVELLRAECDKDTGFVESGCQGRLCLRLC